MKRGDLVSAVCGAVRRSPAQLRYSDADAQENLQPFKKGENQYSTRQYARLSERRYVRQDLPMSKTYRVTEDVEVFPQAGGWHYIPVPQRISAELSSFANRGLIPITATAGSDSWETSLLPKGDGTHFIALSAPIRKRNRIEVGDRITVSFEPRSRDS